MYILFIEMNSIKIWYHLKTIYFNFIHHMHNTNRVSSKVKTSFRFILNRFENLGSIPNTR